MRKPRWYYRLRYGKLEGIRLDIRTGLWFLKLAFLAARGEICIIETEEIFSKGGYKYKSYIVSRLPVSASHDYSTI